MFKYLWIIILVIFWLLWAYSAIKDCIKVFKKHEFADVLDFCNSLKMSSFAFILDMLLIIIGFSFYEWLVSLVFIE